MEITEKDRDIIHKFLSNSLTEVEKVILQEKFNADPEFAKLLKTYVDSLLVVKTFGKSFKLKKTSSFKIIHIFSIAASVLFIALISSFLYFPFTLNKLVISDKASCIDTLYFKYQTRSTSQINDSHKPEKFKTLKFNPNSINSTKEIAIYDSLGYENIFYLGLHNLFHGNYLQSVNQLESIINDEAFIQSDYYYPAMFYLFVLYVELDEFDQAEYTAGLLLLSDEAYIKEQTEKLLKEYSMLVYLKIKIAS